MSVEPGKFEWTAEYETSPLFQATWAFLDDGEGEARLLGGPSGYVLGGCYEVSPPPNVTVEEVVLLIDAELAVPATLSTWGRVKAGYR